ncbi:MAG TPA: alpha/beta hydrolase [Gaiellaceae bacterium]|nr:alpha/beta hydrolase [Gaiellaceae bacterium]
MLVGTDVRDETRAFNDAIRAQMRELPPVELFPPEQTRRARYEGRGLFGTPTFVPEAQWVDADGVRLRVLASDDAPGVYLHVHGGGWTFGGADLQDVALRQLVRETGLAVASVEYRLAPEHPFPAARDDCVAAARWLANGGAAEIGAPPVLTIGGESAGAHLAALTLLALRGEVEFAGANLAYGAYDLSGTPSRRAYDDVLVLTGSSMEWFTGNLLPGRDEESRRDPDVSPLYADLRDLCPALFFVGTCDPLLDDSLFMAARWEIAGNETELLLFDEGAHGFNAFPIALSRLANEAQARFLARAASGAAV